MSEYHFTCDLCSQQAPEAMQHFAPVDDWLIVYPERKLAHIHFGHSTASEDVHTAETQWIYDYMMQTFTENTDLIVCVVADLELSDDSESPSSESMKLYKKILKHPQVDLVVFYGASSGMIFFLKMLMKFVSKSVAVVRTKEEADALYEEWVIKQ